MIHHLGRLIDHVHLRVSNLEGSRRFYEAVLQSLGRGITQAGDNYFAADELFVSPADGEVSRVHLAFQAGSREAVRAFHAAGLRAGGRDNGGPGERAYHPGYYAAFLLDPDGHNVEAVWHGPARRSAPSVTVEPQGPLGSEPGPA